MYLQEIRIQSLIVKNFDSFFFLSSLALLLCLLSTQKTAGLEIQDTNPGAERCRVSNILGLELV